MPHLVYHAPGSRAPRTFELHKHYSTIGSSDDNDLQVADPAMATTHALVRFDGKVFSLQAFGAADLVVNGKRKKKHELEHQDEILLGETILSFRLYDKEEALVDDTANRRGEAYARVLTLSRRLLEHYETRTLLADLMSAIVELTEADKGFLLLDEQGQLRVRVAHNVAEGMLADDGNPFSDSIVARVVASRTPLILADAGRDAEFAGSRSVVNLRVCSVLCVPLLDRDQLLGILYVANDNVVNLFTELHLEVATILGAQASLILARALAMDELRTDNQRLQARLDEIRFGTLVGSSEPMQAVYRKVEKVAATDVSVLITGETGTGKELIAREIHNRSDRRAGPFVTINCGAIPENLLESELFGHVKGAFTGAVANRAGKFQAAHGGTLFLDEIGEMPVNLQVKILRALQERTVTRVGDNRSESVDIRILAATHRDLRRMIGEGGFREDLFYRLNVVPINLPPLRDRGEDIVLIAQYLLEKFVRELGNERKRFGREALAAIRRATWPGNIRQLENHIKKAVILSDGASISPADLDLETGGSRVILPLNDARERWQRQYILDVLTLNGGNRTQTARDLAVDPRTVFRFLEKEGDRGEDEHDTEEP